jgi:hypothetical protein
MTLILSGSPSAGETWTAEVDGTPLPFDVTAVDDLTAVAASLTGQIDSLADYTATSAVNPDTSITITVTHGDGTAFTLDFDITYTSLGVHALGGQFTTEEIEFSGTPRAGETWRITLNGTDYEFDTSSGDTFTDIVDGAGGLHGQLNAVAHFTAVSDTAADGSTSTVTLTNTAGTAFTLVTEILYTPQGSCTVDGQLETVREAVIGGTPDTGEIWTLTMNDGSNHTVSTTVGGAISTINHIANDLAARFTALGLADFSIIVVDNGGGSYSLVVSNANADPFTLSLSITPTTDGIITPLVTPVLAWEQSIQLLNGEPVVDGTWQIALNDTVNHSTFTVGNQLTENGRRAAMAEYFYVRISAEYPGYSATWQSVLEHSRGFTVTSDTGEVFTLVLLRDGVELYNETHTAATGGLTINFRNYDTSTGDVFTLILNRYQYESQAGDTDLTDIATGLAQSGGLFDIPAWYSPTHAGSRVILRDPSGLPMDIGTISRTVTYTDITSIEADTRTHYFTNGDHEVSIRIVSNEYDSLGNIPAYETWTLELDDNMAVEGDEYLTYITEGKKVIEVATGFEDLFDAGSDYVVDSRSVSGNAYFRIFDSPKQTVTANVLQGSGEVLGTFDIDHGSAITGYIPVFVFGGMFFNIINVPYAMYPLLQLTDSTGAVLAGKADNTYPGDAGSTSAYDPTLEYKFGAAGTYRIQVGYYVDFNTEAYADIFSGAYSYVPLGYVPGMNPGVLSDYTTGVYPGQSYQLNVSVQRHAVSTAAVDLEGKTLNVIDGLGAGNSYTITGYDGRTNTYTVENEAQLDSTSQFTVTYLMQDEFTDYEAVADDVLTDSYRIVLSRALAAGEEVYIDVTPVATRTYNADEAFNEDANNGENNAIQVYVETPRAVVDLAGQALIGEKIGRAHV